MLLKTFLATFTLFAGLVAAMPNGVDESFALVRRGDDEGVKCPSDKSDCKKGCIYIKCGKCDWEEDCCEKKGLEEEKPYVSSLSSITADI